MDIVLLGLNARYTHTSYGLFCLRASLGALRKRSLLIESTIHQPLADVIDHLAAQAPKVVAIGVYIWNRTRVEALVAQLKTRMPSVKVVLGGPEIAYDTESALAKQAHVVICGEGEVAFPAVCEALLNGQVVDPVITADPLPVAALKAPLWAYRDEDIENRVLYVETARGCPCRCAYCLSARDQRVRLFDLDRVLPALGKLIERGGRRVKFIDRSFNLYPTHAARVLDFLRAHWREGMQVHVEMTPLVPSEALQARLLRFPPGALHLEVGVQTLNPDVARRVGRACDGAGIEAALRFFIETLQADVHVDLIAGLPGEDFKSFKRGFDSLVALHPAELQVGVLKRLHGAPLAEDAERLGLQFNASPPYEVIETDAMPDGVLDAVKRFALHWDRAAHRGFFPRALPRLLACGVSPYDAFDDYSRGLAAEAGLQGVGLVEQSHAMLAALQRLGVPVAEAKALLRDDYLDGGRRICPPRFLR